MLHLEPYKKEQSQQCCADQLVAINSELAVAFSILNKLVLLDFCCEALGKEELAMAAASTF